MTAIYSRGDGVVAWQACIDRHTPDVEHVEVRGTHTGLGFNPDVYAILADRLAATGPARRREARRDPASAERRRPARRGAG